MNVVTLVVFVVFVSFGIAMFWGIFKGIGFILGIGDNSIPPVSPVQTDVDMRNDYEKGYDDALVRIAAEAANSPETPVDDLLVRVARPGVQIVSEQQQRVDPDNYSYENADDQSQEPAEDIWGGSFDGAQSHAATREPGLDIPAESKKPQKVEDTPGQVLNMPLYAGALLIVGAAAAFVATSGSPLLKTAAIWIAVVIFYIAGIWMYRKDQFKHVATSFMGIGIALVPFAGIVTSATLNIPPVFSWVIVSIVLVGLCGYMSYRIQSEVASYTTLLSVVSLAVALSRSVTEDIFWLFIPIVVVGFLLQLVYMYKQEVIPEWSKRSVSLTSVIAPLLTLVIAVPYLMSLGYVKFEILLAVVFLQFLTYYLYKKVYTYELLVRAIGSVLILVIGAHLASEFAGSMLLFTGTALTLAAVANIAITVMKWPRQQSDALSSERSVLWIGMFILWIVEFLWYMSGSVSAIATIAQLVIIIGVSLVISQRLKQPLVRYSAIAAIWALPYVITKLPIIPESSTSLFLALYYTVISIVLCGVYYLAQSRSRITQVQVIALLCTHLLSALGHSAFFATEVLVYVLLVLFMAFVLFARYERQSALFVVAQAVLLLAGMRLFYDITLLLSPATMIIPGVVVAVIGWFVTRIDERFTSKQERQMILLSSIVMTFIGFILSYHYILNETYILGKMPALLGVLSLVVTSFLTLDYHIQFKSTAFKELAYSFFALAGLYTVYILDADSIIHDALYITLLGAIPACVSYLTRSAQRMNLYQIAAQIIFMGAFSATLPAAVLHDPQGYWGVLVSAASVASVVLYYVKTKQKPALEAAVYIAAIGAMQAVYITDTYGVLPFSAYMLMVGVSFGSMAFLYADRTNAWRRDVLAMIVFGIGYVTSLQYVSNHDLAALWGVLSLLCMAVIFYIRFTKVHEIKNIEYALYATVIGLSTGIMTVDSNEVLEGIVYVHFAAASVLAAAFLYKGKVRAVRLRIGMGILTALVGIRALFSGGIYQIIFLLEHVVLLVLGSMYAQKWAMVWAIIAIGLSVFYMIATTWIVLFGTGLALIAFAIYRSTRPDVKK